ncbi:FIVAR domain-containing protein [Mycobacterium sp. DL440]|uniref:FIVAR domain-containing protein n=1 Tax=Mycobacterium sp. DL440 TaxID=2675523 RepID=UPI0014201AA1|nr:FIVAR domain-containing protein [Mycobacterium sp. DL440]
MPRSRRGKATVAAAMAGVLVVGLLGAAYETSPGGSLWGVTRTVFPGHAQDVALTAVVADLKKAQDILGSGQQPTADQLTDARTALNQAKQDLDYLSPSPERTSMQNLYLQLTQQLLQYTPDSVQRLAPLPAPPPAPPAGDPQPDAVALTSATAPTWGYGAPDDYVPAPPGVPDSPMADWPQPIDPPLTPNLTNLGYYDPSWGQLYGYDTGNWYNYDLSGYNRYGYDFIGFDRWGYDRWGYDRWGYDRWGYNWAGYNWSGYDRRGWDRNGCNEWGQHRDRPWEGRNQGWYDRHHPYQQYYEWKFQNHNPVYRRAHWDRAHGFNPHLYQNWNMNRDWHNPRNRDWAPPAVAASTAVNIHITSPVVSLNASLTQFISNDRATRTSGPLMKDLADKSARTFARDLTHPTPRTNPLIGWQPPSTLGQRPDTPKERHQTSSAPQALTAPPELAAPAPAAPPSKVSPGFTAPKLSPVPAYTPPTIDKARGKPGTAPAPEAGPDPFPGLPATPPHADRPNPAAASPDQPEPASPPNPAHDRPDEVPAPRQTAPDPQAPASDAPAAPETPRQQEPPQRRNAPEEPPAQRDPAPKVQVPEAEAPAPKTQAPEPQAPVWQEPPPAPKREAPAPKETPAPKYQAPERQAPVWQEPAQQAPPQEAPARQQPRWEAPARQQPSREAPARQERPTREAPAPRQAPQPRSEPASPKGPKCPPPMCSGHG